VCEEYVIEHIVPVVAFNVKFGDYTYEYLSNNFETSFGVSIYI